MLAQFGGISIGAVLANPGAIPHGQLLGQAGEVGFHMEHQRKSILGMLCNASLLHAKQLYRRTFPECSLPNNCIERLCVSL